MRFQKMTRLLSALLALALVLGSSFSAMAAGAFQDSGLELPADAFASLVDAKAVYQDGVYEGSGAGRNGEIRLKVTLTQGAIAKIEVIAQKETASYWKKALGMMDHLLGKTSAQEVDAVDTVTGATLSCNGIKEAVKDALAKAETNPGPQPGGIFASGTGTAEDPYVIATSGQLQAFAASVNAGESYAGQYLRMEADLDLSGQEWTPIGFYQGETAVAFCGSFDGCGHTVSGLAIGTAEQPAHLEAAGLFGVLGENGHISRLNVEGAAIYNHMEDLTLRPMVGLLVASMDGSSDRGVSVVDGCRASGTILNYTQGDQYAYLGGLVGGMGWGCLIANSWSEGSVSGGGHCKNFVGGIVGQGGNESAVVNSASCVAASAQGGSNNAVGGIVGEMAGGIVNCYATGDTTTDDISYGDMPDVAIGALVGETPYGYAAYGCYYSTGSVQTVNGQAMDRVYPLGMEPYSLLVGDDTYCYGKEASFFAGEEGAAQMNQGRQEAESADAYFGEAYGILKKKMADYSAMTQNGWGQWQLVDGRLVPVVEEPVFQSGSGTTEDPYRVHTEGQLRSFAASVNAGQTYAGQVIALGNDVSLTREWIPIGQTGETVFDGTFLGDGHVISHLTIGSQEAPANRSLAGLFGVLGEHAVISGVQLEDTQIFIETEGEWNRAYAGSLVARAGAGAVVDRCGASGGTVSVSSEAYSYAAGLVAYAARNLTLTNAWADVTVSAQNSAGMATAGGLAATVGNGSLVMNCAALGQVSSRGDNLSDRLSNYAGGLLSMPSGVTYNCYASGDVEVSNKIPAQEVSIGGVIGELTPNGSAVNLYYNTDAVLTVDGAALAETIGIGGLGGVCLRIQGEGKHVMASSAMASLLDRGLSRGNLQAAEDFLAEHAAGYEPGDFEARMEAVPGFCSWVQDRDGRVLPVGEAPQEDPALDFFEGGSGTEADPYLIRTEEQLRAFAASLNAKTDYTGQYVALAEDLDVSGEAWTPIGTSEEGNQFFQGTLDGRGHTVRGVTIGSEAAPYEDADGDMCFGLFGGLGELAMVKNLGVIDARIYVRSQNSVFAGTLAGYSAGAGVDGCYSTGTIRAQTTNDGNNFAGGLIGAANYGYIVNSWTDVDVDSQAKLANAEAGGIAGLAAFGIVANCYTLGDASGWTDRTVDDGGVTYLAGLVGCQAGQLANCYEAGNMVSRSWSTMVGAVAGMSSGISSSCYNFYNAGAIQEIDGMKANPVEPIGQLVGSGIGEDGEIIDGGIALHNVGLTPAELASQTLVDRLNANFATFPVDVDQALPQGVTLKKWVLQEGVVTLGSEDATVTYVPVERPVNPVRYVDGTYYGRAAGTDGAWILVQAQVQDSRLVRLEILEHGEEANFDALAEPVLALTLEEQTAPAGQEGDSAPVAALKEAIDVVLNKALLGDTSGYDEVDPSIFAGGTGTKADPYQIATAQQLRDFAASVNEVQSYWGQYVVLTQDISLEKMEWMPVGGAGAYPFCGTLDGQGHVIAHMTIGSQAEPASYVAAGLFACLDGAVVKNLAIRDAALYTARKDSSRVYAGLVAAVMDSSSGTGALVDHCAVSGRIETQSGSWNDCGGIAGYCWESVISNCGADVEITASSTGSSVDAGGLVGMNGFAGLLNNYALGSIYATAGVNSASIGGLAGMQAGVAVNNYTDVALNTTRASVDVGGITGRNTGIAAVYRAYFSSTAQQRSGNTVLNPPVAVGTNVTMGTTGILEDVESRTSEQLRSGAFRDLLNENCADATLKGLWQEALDGYAVSLAAEPEMDEWVTGEDGVVKQKNSPVWGADMTLPFQDVQPGTWYSDAVRYVYANKLFRGITETKFAPDLAMSRGMLVTVLYRMAGSPDVEGMVNPFADVSQEQYYGNAVTWAAQEGLVKGMTATKFAPNNPVTREQMATILYRFAIAHNFDVSQKGDLSAYPDGNQVMPYAQDAMVWAVGSGILQGNYTAGVITLSPCKSATRAQVAVVLMRFLQGLGE